MNWGWAEVMMDFMLLIILILTITPLITEVGCCQYKTINIMNKYLVICILFGSIFSCKKISQEGAIVDLMINLTIESSDGKDLLNPNTPNAIKAGDINIFYEINGKRETYLSTSNAYKLDNPAGFTVNKPDNSFGNKYFLTIFSNPDVNNNSITVIAVSGREEIKIISEVTQTSNSHSIAKIWYKNNLVWPIAGNDGPKYVQTTLAQ